MTLAAGCSGGDGGTDGDPGTQPWPLTGLDGYPDGDGRQAITVKIENTPAGRPQIGIGQADLVVQELVEGGLTRLAAMYQSQYPDMVGPVRSMRETDIGIVLPTAGTLAASGGSGSTVSTIESAGVPVAVEGDPGFSRAADRRSPYNVMLNVAELGATLPDSPPPGPYLPFGQVPEGAVGAPAAGLNLRWPGSSSAFAYDAQSGTWNRTDLPDASGFSFTNVIALSLPVTFGAGTDAAGTPIPTMVTTGSGKGIIATGGAAYEVTWSKASQSAPWKFSFPAAGGSGALESFTVPPGRSWLALLPDNGGSTTVTPPPDSGGSS